MNEEERRTVSIRFVAGFAAASGLLTWLCVSWVGSQGPLTAGVAVLLVELFLACFAAISVLLAARITDSYMRSEARHTEDDLPEPRMWLWRPLWLPAQHAPQSREPLLTTRIPVNDWLRTVHDELRPLQDFAARPETIPLSIPVTSSFAEPNVFRIPKQQTRRAA